MVEGKEIIDSPYYKKLVAPYENEEKMFIKSFALKEEKEIKKFFDKYGFVVIQEVLNKEELELSIEEVHVNLKEHSLDKYDRSDLETLKYLDKFTKRFGLIGGGSPVMLPQAIKNRINDKVFKSYQVATGQKKFICAHERYGFMIPTKIHPDMVTIENWLHIDYNPLTGKTSTFGYDETPLHESLTEGDPLRWQTAYFQGIVALEDCPVEVGGFDCVPGFHNYCEQWKENNLDVCRNSDSSRDPTTVRIPRTDEIINWVQKIPFRKGSLLIWDGRLAHSNFPNQSTKPRLVQYVKLNAVGKTILSNVKTSLTNMYEGEKVHLKKIMPQLSEQQLKIVGLVPWD